MLSLAGNTSIENACQPVGEYLVQNSNHRIYLGTSKQHYTIHIRSWSIAVDLVVNSFTDYRVLNTQVGGYVGYTIIIIIIIIIIILNSS
jgi:hypothetical protein